MDIFNTRTELNILQWPLNASIELLCFRLTNKTLFWYYFHYLEFYIHIYFWYSVLYITKKTNNWTIIRSFTIIMLILPAVIIPWWNQKDQAHDGLRMGRIWCQHCMAFQDHIGYDRNVCTERKIENEHESLTSMLLIKTDLCNMKWKDHISIK